MLMTIKQGKSGWWINPFYFIWGFYSLAEGFLSISELPYIANINAIHTLTDYLTFAMLMFMLICSNRYTRNELVMYIALVVFTFFIGLQISQRSFLIQMLFILCFSQQDFNKFVRFDIKIKIAVTVTIFALCGLGVLGNYIHVTNFAEKQALGFSHPNIMGIFVFAILLEFLYLKYRKMHFIDWIGVFAIGYVTYWISGARTGAYTFLVIYMLFIVANYFPQILQTKTVLIIFASIILIIAVMSVAAVYLYNQGNEIISQLDILMSHRISLMANAVNKYGITLFGQKVEIIGTRRAQILSVKASPLDNAYIRCLLNYGLILFVAFCSANFVLIKNTLRKGRLSLALICIFYIVLGFGESSMLNPIYNIGLLCLLDVGKKSAFEYDAYDTYASDTSHETIRKRKTRIVWKLPIWLDEDDGKATGIREENVSFGVFGTLIRRSVARPADLFRIMEQNDQSVPEQFAEKRMEAEQAAFAKLGVRMGLADIYEELIPLYGAHTNDLMALEIQYEIAGCRPVPENIDLVNLCMEHDKNVFLMADTYLPSSVLRRMLDVCGVYHYDRLYVSCEEGACKADGSLFWKVLADQEIRPHELRHIGSDRQGDVTEPWRVGVHVKRGKKKGQSAVDKELPEDIALYERTLQACIRNCAEDLDSDDARLGCETFGPLLAGFTAWLREQLRRDGVQDAYFLAGDGSVLKQAFDALEDGGFRTHSLYFPAQIVEQDHEALLAYIRACGMQGRVALVDTGRQDAVQKTLKQLIAEAGLDIQVKGYYVGLADTDGMQAAGYLYEPGKGTETLEKLSPVMAIFDTVFYAQHGAVRRIAMRDGQPVLELDAYEYASDEGRICDEIAILRAYQAGALALVREMNTAFPGGVPQIPGEAVLLPLLRMGTNPTRQEAELWGDFRVFEDGKATLMARPKGLGAYLLHPGQLKRDYAASPWKIGFLRRMVRLPLAYDKIVKNR